MRQLKKKARKDLRPDPENPRKVVPEAELVALAESLKQYGQQVPLIAFDNQILDGHRRWLAAPIANLEHLDVLELESRPTPTELRLLQLSIDFHKSSFNAIERSDLVARLMRENNWSVSETAEKANMKQSQVSKLLKYQEGCADLQAALAAGQIDQDKAYAIIAAEPDHEKQRELMAQAGDLTREQLRQKARSKGQAVAMKTSVARFTLPKGVMVTVQGPKMDLSGAINAMLDALRVLKKGQADSWDIVTAARVMKDRARAAS